MACLSAIIRQHGGPEVIEWVEGDIPSAGPGEALVEHTAIGINFIDTYHRTGLYPVELPSGLGKEAAGKIVAVGEGVTLVKPGDRVAYMDPGIGTYSTHRVVPAAILFALPDTISDEIAAAALLKTCTVEALAERCASVSEGDTVLVHAAAGGVGLLLVQWLKSMGAVVIGTTSSEDKASAARAAGADHTILYTEEDVAPKVREITEGRGVPTVFDGVGMSTWEASLDSLAPRGLLISFGNAGGAVTGVNLGILSAKGSLFVTRPTIGHYYATPQDAALGYGRVSQMLASGALEVTIGQTYPLTEAAQAHCDLEARKTTGSSILIP